jgi:regulator of protease activity HflC (stomatin/prohibitin superfamily)
MAVNKALGQAAGAKPGDVVEVIMEKQVSAEAMGRARLHAAEGNREFDLERQAGRDERTAASEGDARSED